MKLIINIPEEVYKNIQNKSTEIQAKGYTLENAVLNGTLLPKGYGRLCDLDAALKCVDNDSVIDCDAKWQAIGLFEWAMAKRVVIEADGDNIE